MWDGIGRGPSCTFAIQRSTGHLFLSVVVRIQTDSLGNAGRGKRRTAGEQGVALDPLKGISAHIVYCQGESAHGSKTPAFRHLAAAPRPQPPRKIPTGTHHPQHPPSASPASSHHSECGQSGERSRRVRCSSGESGRKCRRSCARAALMD